MILVRFDTGSKIVDVRTETVPRVGETVVLYGVLESQTVDSVAWTIRDGRPLVAYVRLRPL